MKQVWRLIVKSNSPIVHTGRRRRTRDWPDRSNSAQSCREVCKVTWGFQCLRWDKRSRLKFINGKFLKRVLSLHKNEVKYGRRLTRNEKNHGQVEFHFDCVRTCAYVLICQGLRRLGLYTHWIVYVYTHGVIGRARQPPPPQQPPPALVTSYRAVVHAFDRAGECLHLEGSKKCAWLRVFFHSHSCCLSWCLQGKLRWWTGCSRSHVLHRMPPLFSRSLCVDAELNIFDCPGLGAPIKCGVTDVIWPFRRCCLTKQEKNGCKACFCQFQLLLC